MQQEGFSSFSKFIITGVFLVIAIYYLQNLLIPVLYGAFLAMLFLPMANFLEKKKFPRGLSIATCLFSMIVSIVLIIFFTYGELAKLSTALPLFEKKAWEKFEEGQLLVEKISKVSVAQQSKWIENNYSKAITAGSDVVKELLISFSHGVELLVFVIIYFFFFLLLRDRFRVFIYKLFKEHHHTGLKSVLDKTQFITRKYMSGQVKVMVIIGVLNAVGFMLIGVKQAIFWGFLRGLLNIIPYIGPILGAIFPTLSAMTYEEGIWAPLAVIGVVAGTQILQDNYLIPRFVGSKLKLNPLITIMAILIGGMLWGVNGMILFLPLVGIIKVICDNVDSLKPYGYLLGDE